MATGQLFSRTTQALFYNYKQLPIQRMLDFDFLCGRELPSVAGIINPGAEGFQKLFFGQEEIAIPVHSTVEAACAAHPTADVFINFASFRSAAASSMAALKQPTIRVVAIIAEGVPESDTKQLIAYARANNKVVIGPATVGGIQAGSFKIGDTAGTIDNIVACKLYRPGSVGFVSKSGGMSNELYNTIARVTDGIYEGIAIGGDVFPGSTLSDHVLRFNNIPQVKMIVVLGELGGRDEYSLVEALKQGKVNKPVVAWVSGTCARLFKSEVQFGHAGAKSGGEMESAQAKNQALKDAGAAVPTSYEAFETAIKETFEKLVEEGKISSVKEFTPPQIPEDLNIAIKSGKVRAPTHIISTISDDRGEEPCYAGVPMSSIVEQGYGVGDVISLLWFKRSLPRYCTHFIEICIMLCADHGPCVSGAHNTIVTARAGKDLVSSLVSGLLTIGPRFGGAIDDAARYFKDAYDRGLTPYEFVESMKKKGIRVPGIGHRIKRGDNRDKRVELLQQFAHTHFPSVKYMEYAVQVETYTLSKANNLVLNVDGAIGSLFLDLLAGSGMFSKQEIDEIVGIGYLNGLFVLARSIGLIGHTFDQKRLKQPLYRHPWEDVLYTKLVFCRGKLQVKASKFREHSTSLQRKHMKKYLGVAASSIPLLILITHVKAKARKNIWKKVMASHSQRQSNQQQPQNQAAQSSGTSNMRQHHHATESVSKAIAQYTVDAQLHAVFEQSGGSGKSFDYSQSVRTTNQSVPEEQITAYLSKIQRGGHIQPFGCMIAVDEGSFRIIAYSENAKEMLGLTPKSVLSSEKQEILSDGTDVRTLFRPSSSVMLEKAFGAREITLLNPIWIHSKNSGKPFYAILHRIDVGIVIDLEPARTEDPALSIAGAVQSQKLAVRSISQLQSLPGGDIKLLCDTVVKSVRELTGYDRVMVYKFHEDEHGEVVAETKRADLEPYIGLHYPSTDIPQASRFLFKQNRVRMIVDCHATPVRVIQDEALMQPLCLVGSTLRAPHGCHAQYMANMGSIASMAMAVIINGNDEEAIGGRNSTRLWGFGCLPSHFCSVYSISASLCM
ncbi:hypothetical protein OIU77_012149 [Salix suchowensis]|nr:hypothetical protein OIU77_012149 [Salix suchowensis]